MIGVYEHRRFFRCRYEVAFEILESGILYKSQRYPWNEIISICKTRSSGGTEGPGAGIIQFRDGKRCTVNLFNFRKKGEKKRLTFWGTNLCFEALREQMPTNPFNTQRPPRLDELQGKINELMESIHKTKDELEITALFDQMDKYNKEQLTLNLDYINQMKNEIKQTRQSLSIPTWLYLAVAIGMVFSFLLFALAKA